MAEEEKKPGLPGTADEIRAALARLNKRGAGKLARIAWRDDDGEGRAGWVAHLLEGESELLTTRAHASHVGLVATLAEAGVPEWETRRADGAPLREAE